jgi:DNA adenine methylase
MSKTVTRAAVRYHGGKFRLAGAIIPLFPPHSRYVEPFGGGASVLLRKERRRHEIYNDLDDRVYNFFSVLRDEQSVHQLIDLLNKTPYSRTEFNLAMTQTTFDPIENARQFIVLSCMGFSTDAATRNSKTGFRSHENAVRTFSKGFEHLRIVHERLKGVVIENKHAFDVIDQYDSPDTLFYVDPPYVLSTRNNRNGGYRHELSDAGHIELAKILHSVRGHVVLSGYSSELYNDLYANWKTVAIDALAQSKKGNIARTERLWINREAA